MDRRVVFLWLRLLILRLNRSYLQFDLKQSDVIQQGEKIKVFMKLIYMETTVVMDSKYLVSFRDIQLDREVDTFLWYDQIENYWRNFAGLDVRQRTECNVNKQLDQQNAFDWNNWLDKCFRLRTKKKDIQKYAWKKKKVCQIETTNIQLLLRVKHNFHGLKRKSVMRFT